MTKYLVDYEDDAGNIITKPFSTLCCGTCAEFYHRSFLAGGCAIGKIAGEIGYNHPKCESWRLKDKFQ